MSAKVVYKRGQYLVLGPRLHHLASGLLTLFVHHNSQVNSRFNNRIMGGLIPTCLLLLISLTAAVSTHPDSKLQSLHLMGKEKRGLETFGLQKRCTGSCAECFGDGYQECASSSSICFKPGDAQHGEDTCSSSGTVDSTTPTTPTSDFCTSGGCAVCFGDGYQDCPDSSLYCYLPGDSLHGLDSCTSDTGSPTQSAETDSPTSSATSDSSESSSGGFDSTSTDYCDNGDFDCKRCFGQTYIPCPDSSQSASTNYCYDPNNSTSICPDGTTSGGGSGSSGTGSSLSSDSASYTASASSGATSTDSGAGSTSATGVSGSGASGINIQSSKTSTSLRSTVTTSGSQTSASSRGSNGSPISAKTSGQPSKGEGVFGFLVVIALCFASLMGLLV
jgi:hypothetical protein